MNTDDYSESDENTNQSSKPWEPRDNLHSKSDERVLPTGSRNAGNASNLPETGAIQEENPFRDFVIEPVMNENTNPAVSISPAKDGFIQNWIPIERLKKLLEKIFPDRRSELQDE